MKILILGGDGYLGWPTAMRFAATHDVTIADNLSKRLWEAECGVAPLWPILPLQTRARIFERETGRRIAVKIGDLTNHRFVYELLAEGFDAIVHYGEQPSAPYSMMGREKAVATQANNVIGTLNVLFAMRRFCPDAHLVKLGTMGEYGTPNIAIEEGYIRIEHEGRTDVLPFPKLPGSFYHCSKVHDSTNMHLACRIWGLRVTDLNQGVVYGVDTDETRLCDELRTSFHYDAIFGTVINRFMVQAVAGHPLTVYGKGGQTRGFLDIRDTLACVELAVMNPAAHGEMRVFNQFTEQFSVQDLAYSVLAGAQRAGIKDTIVANIPNPRVELEEHFYEAKHTKLVDLGLKPHLLSLDYLASMMERIKAAQNMIDPTVLEPNVKWKSTAA
jgi:UDP-sulfoquinovose synthase